MESIKERLKIAIEKQRQLLRPTNTGEMKVVDTPTAVVQGWLNALKWMDKLLDSQSEEDISEDLFSEIAIMWAKNCQLNKRGDQRIAILTSTKFCEIARHFFELGLNARKED